LDKAETDINQSIELDPYNGWAYRNKGIFYFMKGDYPSAQRLLVQAEKMDPLLTGYTITSGRSIGKTE